MKVLEVFNISSSFILRQCVCQESAKTIYFGMICPSLQYCHHILILPYFRITDHSTGFISFSRELSIYLDKPLSMATKDGEGGVWMLFKHQFFRFSMSTISFYSTSAYVPTVVKCWFEWICKGNPARTLLLGAVIITDGITQLVKS